MRRWRAWVPALLLASLAALTWWLDQKVQPLNQTKETASRNDPSTPPRRPRRSVTDIEPSDQAHSFRMVGHAAG